MNSTELLEISEKKEFDVIYCIMPHRADKRGLLRTDVFLRSYAAIYANQGVDVDTPQDMAGKTLAIPRDSAWAKKLVQPFLEKATIVYAA